MERIVIPYGPDHRREKESLIGVEFDPSTGKYGTNWHALTIAQECLCGITYKCYRIPDGRILVERTDRYTCYSAFTFWPDYQSWQQWWYVDRRRGEIDPETGRYRN